MGLLELYQNSPNLNGDTPYKQASDPTSYPADSNHVEGTRGYFAQPALAPTKFNQIYTPNNTYLNYISSYI